MSLTSAQFLFASEFVTLAVVASALALLVLRPSEPGRSITGSLDPPSRRTLPIIAAALALLVLGAASFAHGSLLVTGADIEWLGLGRVVAAAALLLFFPYPGGPRAGRPPIGGALFRLGFLAWLAAGATELARSNQYSTDIVLVLGSLLVAAALLRVAYRSIAVRVAASGAATLLLVVVVLATALSTVISSSVQRQELKRLAARASIEGSALSDTTDVTLAAGLVEADLSGYFQGNRNPLVDFASNPQAAYVAGITNRISALQGLTSEAGLAYTTWDGTWLLAGGNSAPVKSPGFTQYPGLAPGGCDKGNSGLYVVGGVQLLLASSSPACGSDRSYLGVVLVLKPLDSSYLISRQRIDPSVSLALVTNGNVLGTSGIDSNSAENLAFRVPIKFDQTISRAVGDQLVGAASFRVRGAPRSVVVQLLVTEPPRFVLSTRDKLFRTLFLIAFGGTVIALMLAIFTGDRITAGLRRLTGVATAIQRGETGLRAGVGGDDEVAALGVAFDSMLDSVVAQSAALRTAADDETRLRNRLEAVVAGMTDGLVAVDRYGHITDFNRAAAELTGVPVEKALGAPAEKIILLRNEDGSPASRSLFRAGARDMAMMGRVQRASEEIPVAVSSGALRDPDGEPVGTVLVFRDMRREHEVEQMKTEFLSRVGHELRTPLTGIMGYADILLRRDVPVERARAWYDEILQSARRLLRIVEMLEFFASEGAGRIVLRPEPIDVRSLVNGIASGWSGRMHGHLSIGRRLTRHEAMVSADRRWLSLAVDELIDNAVKFSPEGGRIVVRVTASQQIVEIAVTDQGMGMTEEQYEVIFGDFMQGDNSDTRRFGGLGLGLAVVRRVVEGHGGRVTCRSTPGKGSTFTLTFPAWPEGGPLPPEPRHTNGSARPGRRAARASSAAPSAVSSSAASASALPSGASSAVSSGGSSGGQPAGSAGAASGPERPRGPADPSTTSPGPGS